MRGNLSQQVPSLIGWTRESSQLKLSQQITCVVTERSETSEKLEVQVKKSDKVPLVQTVKCLRGRSLDAKKTFKENIYGRK